MKLAAYLIVTLAAAAVGYGIGFLFGWPVPLAVICGIVGLAAFALLDGASGPKWRDGL